MANCHGKGASLDDEIHQDRFLPFFPAFALHRAGWRVGDEAGDGRAGPGDHHVLSGLHLFEQFGKLGLGLVYVDELHGNLPGLS